MTDYHFGSFLGSVQTIHHAGDLMVHLEVSRHVCIWQGTSLGAV